MSILAKEDRRDLVWAMRTSLLEQVRSGVLTEGKKAAAENFIINEGTYEQLLNLAFNPQRDTEYKSIEVLEKVALEAYASVLEEATKVVEEKKEVVAEAKKEVVAEKSVFTALEEGFVQEAKKGNYTPAEKEKVKKSLKQTFDDLVKSGKAKVGGWAEWLAKQSKWKKYAAGAAAATAVTGGAALALKKRRDKKAGK